MKRKDEIRKPFTLVGLTRVLSRRDVRRGELAPPTLSAVILRYASRAGGGRLRRLVMRALSLKPRGFVRHDVLVLSDLSARLKVEWRSRDLHPWDRDLPPERRAERFREQTMRDTDAAITRLFRTLGDVEALEIRVLEPPPSSRLLLAGTVAREDALSARSISSPGMRLRMMGLRCLLRHGHLEPLDAAPAPGVD